MQSHSAKLDTMPYTIQLNQEYIKSKKKKKKKKKKGHVDHLGGLGVKHQPLPPPPPNPPPRRRDTWESMMLMMLFL